MTPEEPRPSRPAEPDGKTIQMLESKGIPWKVNDRGEVIAMPYANRYESRRARFGGTYRESM